MNDATQTEVEPEFDGQQSQLEPVTADSSPATGENQDNNQNTFQDRINKVTAQKYEQKRRADELEAELNELKSKSASAQPVQQDTTEKVSAPVLPQDMYDEDAMRQYHQDVMKYNQHVAETASRNATKTWEQQQQEQKQKAINQERLNSYQQNAVRDGVDFDKLHAAEQVIVQSGIKPELANYLLEDPNGAKIAVHLADNPAQLYELAGMNPMNAAVKIQSEIKPQALSKTPKVTSAPEPLPEYHGGGHIEKDDFERQNPGTEFI